MEKIRNGAQSSIWFHKLQVQPRGGRGQTHPGAQADLKLKISETLAGHVPDRTLDSYRKVSLPVSAPCETNSVASEKSLEDPRIYRKGVPSPKVSPSSLKMAPGSQCSSRSSTTPIQLCSSDLYRCFKSLRVLI